MVFAALHQSDGDVTAIQAERGDSMTRYAKKTDLNHGEIRDALRGIPGMKLLDTSGMAGLGCDLLCSWQDGPPTMLEIKSHPKKPLTDSERRARSMFGEYWHRVETFDDVLRVFGISAEPAPESW